MSDNTRLSDTAAKQLTGTKQRDGQKGAAAPLAIISARGHMHCGHGQWRSNEHTALELIQQSEARCRHAGEPAEHGFGGSSVCPAAFCS